MQEMLRAIRGLTFWLWNILLTPLYSIVCLTALLFSKKAGYVIGKMWCRHLLLITGVSCQVTGLEKIQPYKKYILVCNHQSNLDISVLMVNLPLYVVFIAKKELFRLPFFGWGIKALGHISINRSSPRLARDSIMHACEKLKNKKELSLVVFPEGTRTNDGQVQKFKQGTFSLALDTKLPILPVVIKGTYDALPKTKLLARPAKVALVIGDVVDPKGYTKRRLAQTLEDQISKLMDQH